MLRATPVSTMVSLVSPQCHDAAAAVALDTAVVLVVDAQLVAARSQHDSALAVAVLCLDVVACPRPSLACSLPLWLALCRLPRLYPEPFLSLSTSASISFLDRVTDDYNLRRRCRGYEATFKASRCLLLLSAVGTCLACRALINIDVDCINVTTRLRGTDHG